MREHTIINREELRLMLEELVNKILEERPQEGDWAILGIQRRGADLAVRIAQSLAKHGVSLPYGSLDINLYRDDWTRLADGIPHIGQSTIPFKLDGKTILLADDVLFTGRTIRSALEAMLDYGRPSKVRLLALIDRGHRELPIQADYVGKVLKTSPHEHVDVLLEERDGQEGVILRS